MKINNIIRSIYWHVIPISVFVVSFYYLNKIEDPLNYVKASISFFSIVLLPFMIFHGWLGQKIFKEKLTLTDKIMRCGYRRQYGNSYCVKCPDSYTCASTIGTNDNR